MRLICVLLLVVVSQMTVSSYVADAKDVTKPANQGTGSKQLKARYILRDDKGTLGDQNTAMNNKDEERIFEGVFSKLKALFHGRIDAKQVKPLIQAISPASKKDLSQFFAENPAIKKEIIVAGVLLSLIVAVPLTVKSFYPASR
uniref:RxLR effector protein n=1 Tax=Peronospora matthiolae TaxID=2874970 RepID=A0AAV1TSJ4_9STRA